MGEKGFDTREEDEIDRPLVLGEISHPDDPNGKRHGRRHIEVKHGQEIRDAGFEDALDFISHIITHHNEDTISLQHHSRNLAAKREGEADFIVVHLLPQGKHYRMTTAYKNESVAGRGLFNASYGDTRPYPKGRTNTSSNKRAEMRGYWKIHLLRR